MKLHLPLSLLSAVLLIAAGLSSRAQAVEVHYLADPHDLYGYRTTSGNLAFLLDGSITFTPSSATWWTTSQELKANGSILFTIEEDSDPYSLTFKDGDNKAFYNVSTLAIEDIGRVTFEGLKERDVDYSSSSASASRSYYYGGAIYASTLRLKGNSRVTFTGNEVNGNISTSYTAYAYGGAIYGANGATITISETSGAVTFAQNKAACSSSSAAYSRGGAIYGGSSSTISICGNTGDINFTGNSASADSTTSSYRSYGGAIYGGNYSTISICDNESDVSFTGNSSSAADSSYSYGGAIYGGDYSTISICDNGGDVSFTSNSADSHGGAIYGGSSSTISICDNGGDVSFTGNSSSAAASSYGGAIYVDARSTITLNNNNSVTFNRNSASYGGGICAYESGTINLSNNGSVTFSGNSASSHGGAIYGSNISGHNSTITLNNNSSVTFSGNSASFFGGAIHMKSGDSIELSNNGSVTFSGNSTYHSTGVASGGAISAATSTITLNNNGSVTFSGNSASSDGGAIYGGPSCTITLSNNDSVTFNRNLTSASTGSAGGGAIKGSTGSTIMLSNNRSVTFSANSASSSSGGSSYGGAIYGDTITLRDNDSVTFSRNSASNPNRPASGGAIDGNTINLCNNGGVEFSGNSAAIGGAINGEGNITMNNNGSVTFSGNSASSHGGGIYTTYESGTINLNNNSSVTFSGNSAGFRGGAIYTEGNLSIRNNDSVLFEKNAEITNGNYRLRSVYAGNYYSDSEISLSAAEGKSIEFRDSVYIGSGSTVELNTATVELNADYTDSAGNVIKQEGDIIFTGAYTETHLNELLTANGARRTATAEEIANSRTNEVYALTNLYGGRLRIEDGAIYKGGGITLHEGANATLMLKNGKLNHAGYNITISSGSTLSAMGVNTLTASNIIIQDGAIIQLALDMSQPDSLAVLTTTGNLNIGTITLNLSGTEYLSTGEYKLLTRTEGTGYDISGWTLNGVTSDKLRWENGTLYYSVTDAVDSGETDAVDSVIEFTTRQTGIADYCYYDKVAFNDITHSDTYAHGGALYQDSNSPLTLSNNGSITFSGNLASGEFGYGGAIYGDSITLSDNGSVTFCGNMASDTYETAYGGAIYGNTITLSDNSSVTFCGNVASDTAEVAHSISSGAQGGAIYGILTLSNNDDLTFSENSASSTRFAAYGGAIYGFGITLVNNGNVTFRVNSARGSSSYGGAIYAYGNLSIRNNDSVLFEKNGEITDGTYRLRSLYKITYEQHMISLSAAEGKSIEFRDSVYMSSGHAINLNEDYTDSEGNVIKQEGDIIFTGAYTETHLNELLTADGAGRTATSEEIANSRTSEMHGKVTLFGGTLRVEEQAVLKTTAGLDVAAGSNATVKVSNATLNAGSSDINVGDSGTLTLMNGATVKAANINIADGATFAVVEAPTQEAVATFSLREAASVAEPPQSCLVDANLTFEAGSTLVADGVYFSMTEGSTLTFKALTGGDKINLVLTLGAEYSDNEQVVLFSDVDVVRFILDGVELSTTDSLLANTFFTGAWVNDETTLSYDSSSGTISLQHLNTVSIPEPTTATLSLLALAGLAARRRRK